MAVDMIAASFESSFDVGAGTLDADAGAGWAVDTKVDTKVDTLRVAPGVDIMGRAETMKTVRPPMYLVARGVTSAGIEVAVSPPEPEVSEYRLI